MQDRSPPFRQRLLQRTAGPYIRVMFDPSDSHGLPVQVRFAPKADLRSIVVGQTVRSEWLARTRMGRDAGDDQDALAGRKPAVIFCTNSSNSPPARSLTAHRSNPFSVQ
jgi:hypothetical protein